MHILIAGATFAGVSAACALASHGHSVTLADAHAFAGADVVACQHTWEKNGDARLDRPNGHTKIELYAMLQESGVRTLLCARPCGVLLDAQNRVCGLSLATKYGVFAARADLVLDATEGGVCASLLTGERPRAALAEYGFDMENVSALMRSEESMPTELNLIGHRVLVGPVLRPHAVNICFHFPIDEGSGPLWRTAIEESAHDLTAAIALVLRRKKEYAEARVHRMGSHCRLLYDHIPHDARIPHLPAALPALFTGAERRAQERAAADIALSLASQANAAGECREWIVFGQPIHNFRILPETELGLCPFSFDPEAQSLPVHSADALVAGAGTGGAMSAWALCRHGEDVLLADQLYFCGGTNTVGRVSGAWHGYTGGMFLARSQAVRDMADADCFDPRCGSLMLWSRRFGGHFLGGLTLCGAVRHDHRLTAVLACDEEGLMLLRGHFVIDGTADGDLCAFCGLSSQTGGPREGMVQTSSVWGFEYQPTTEFTQSRFQSDEDVIDPNSYRELLRGLGLGFLRGSEYEIVELCMQRESRRFACRKALTMTGIARRMCHPDTIAVALCRHDTHGMPSSLMNQLGLFGKRMFESGAGDIRVRLPLGLFLPTDLENTAIVGKSMCGEREAVNLCRMNPDICNAAYAVGVTVAHALRQDAPSLEAVDLAPVQAELRALGVLPDWASTPSDALGLPEAMDALSDPADGGFSAMVQPREQMIPLLLPVLAQGGLRAENAARALAWHGCPEAAPILTERLRSELALDALRFEKQGDFDVYAVRADGHRLLANPNARYGYVTLDAEDPECSYTRVNQLLVLLGLSGGGDADLALEIARRTVPSAVLTGRTPYALSRLDTHRLPEETRLLSLVHYFERHPDARAASVLETLADSPALQNLQVPEGWHAVTPPRVALLSIFLCRAAAHCGSRQGVSSLIRWLDDSRMIFSGMARRALLEVTGQALSSASDYQRWLDAQPVLPVTAYRGDPFLG